MRTFSSLLFSLALACASSPDTTEVEPAAVGTTSGAEAEPAPPADLPAPGPVWDDSRDPNEPPIAVAGVPPLSLLHL